MNKFPLIIFDDSQKIGKSAQPRIAQQNLLLKGMMLYGEEKKAAELAGIKTAVELYRTFDRIQLRKGYHQALDDEQIDFNFIASRIKKFADCNDPKAALPALRMLLASLGLNRYDVSEEGSKNWEDILLEVSQKYESKQLNSGAKRYEVNAPAKPLLVAEMEKQETELGKELYEHEI